ncbi:MAG: hypothetical protein HKUEN02_15790 [Anaerolineaceae bacterium]|nr:MAG: hypothetical protein HKUEN02_15790 [Anaerolineaceae bacterium]
MDNLYDVLETCLREIENGAEIETVLLRYPEYADELYPLLETSFLAKEMSASGPSVDVMRRNRAKVLQRAAEMRETNNKSAVRFGWFASLRRLAFTLATLVFAFVSSASLAGAASTLLPGDDLYPAKRSWENLQEAFALNPELRNALKVKHQNERIGELRELFANGRSADVSFNGLVARQSETGWLVAGVRVVTTSQTSLPPQPVPVNSAVRVQGVTQPDGSVLASDIEFLPAGASLPDVEDNPFEADDQPNEDDAPNIAATKTPDEPFDGNLDVLAGDFWTINGVPANMSRSQMVGTPVMGAAVTLEGFFDENGVFIVTKIVFKEDESSDDDGLNSNDDDNNNDDNDGSDDNDDSDDNDNDDDN